MERILNPLGWNLLFATTLALSAWLLGTIPALRRRPKFLYTLWLLVLAKLLVPPMIGLPLLAPLPAPIIERPDFIPQPMIVAMPIEQLPVAVPAPAPPPSFHWTDYFKEPRFWLFTLALTSLLITAILWLRTLLQTRRWRKLLHNSAPVPDRLQDLARIAADRLQIKRTPEIRLVDAQLTPFLWTTRKKVSIVLPQKLVETLSDDQLLCILMHELAHYARRDHWAHTFAGFVTSLFWWNPVSWWAWRELRALQEICCDSLVLQRTPDSRRLYAETLYAVLESLQTRTSAQPALSCSFGDSRHLRRRFSMLADTKLQPRLSPFALLLLLSLTTLFPCLPTRAAPPASESTTPEPQSTSAQAAAPSATPTATNPKRYTIRMSIRSRASELGGGVRINIPARGDESLTASAINLSMPAITVEAGQEATASTKLPEVVTPDSPYRKKSVVATNLSITAKPSPTPDGKISLDLKCEVESEGSTLEFDPPQSPLIIDPGQPEKIALVGPQNDPNLVLEVTVTEANPQPLQYSIEGTFHYQDPKSTEAQHPIESVNGVTLDGISMTFGLNNLALPEFNRDGSFYGMALSPRSVDPQGQKIVFTSKLTEFNLNSRNHKSLESYPEFVVESEKPAKFIFRADENGKPILWFDFTATTISLDASEKALIAPAPGYAPTPAHPGSFHPSLFGVARTDKPADPNATYQLHLTSFVKTPATPDHESEILSETTPEAILIRNQETRTIPRPFQRTFLHGTSLNDASGLHGTILVNDSNSQITASIVRFDQFSNLIRVRLIFKRQPNDSSLSRLVDTSVEIPFNHKLQLVIERDDQEQPIHWLDVGITEPNAPAPTTYAAKPFVTAPASVTQAAATEPAYAAYVHMLVQSHKLPERFWIRSSDQTNFPTRGEFQPILDHITKNFATESWSEKGGLAQYELLLLNHSLVVLSTPEVHAQIAAYLDGIRSIPAAEEKKPTFYFQAGFTRSSTNLDHSTIVAHNLVIPTGKDPFGRPIATREDYEKLIATLKEIEPKSWDTNGGPGKIEYSTLAGVIAFQNTPEVSKKIAQHCSDLIRKNLAANPPPPVPAATPVIQPVSNEVPAKQRSENPLYLVQYNVDKLFDLDQTRDLKRQPLAPADLQTLSDEITKFIAPDSWKSKGGQGMIVSNISPEHGPCLVIRQTDEIHEQINTHLNKLRRERGIDISENFSSPHNDWVETSKDGLLTAKFHTLDTLVDSRTDANGQTIGDRDQVNKLIRDLMKISPESWHNHGGPCSITFNFETYNLTVIATPEVFREVNRHIRKLFNSRHPDQEYYNGPINAPNEVEKAYAVDPDSTTSSSKMNNKKNTDSQNDVAAFNVTDLVDLQPGRDLKTYPLRINDIEPLRKEIVAKIHPENWLDNGGQGRLEIVIRTPVTGQIDHMLVVINSPKEIQRKVEEFLNEKRRQKTEQNKPAHTDANKEQSKANLPTDEEILRSLPDLPKTENSSITMCRLNPRIKVEKILDTLDDPRFYPLVGPARLRKQHFKCTVASELQTTTAESVPYSSSKPLTETVYIDHDHLVRGL